MAESKEIFSAEYEKILGFISATCMRAATLVLSMLVRKEVTISEPKIRIFAWDGAHIVKGGKSVGVRISYSEGVCASNLILLNAKDVKVITNLMMGGDGVVEGPIVLDEMDMSALGEAMNQMVGAKATSLSGMLHKKVNIGTPDVFSLDGDDDSIYQIGYASDEVVALASFTMEIGDLIVSDVVQIFHMTAVKDLVDSYKLVRS